MGKVCSKCKLEKAPSEFYQRRSGVRTGQYYNKCIECDRSIARKYYHLHQQVQSTNSRLRRKRIRESTKEYLINLKSNPCQDCGFTYPYYVMEFDHKDGSLKKGDISKIANAYGWSREKLFEEIQKCDLVCANCHRARTYQRLISAKSGKIN